MRDILKALNNPAMDAMRAFQNSPAMQATRNFQNSPIMQALKAIQNSPTMVAMRVLQDSPAIQAIRDFQNSPITQALQGIQNSPTMVAMRVLQDSPAVLAIRDLQNSPITQALQGIQNSPAVAAMRVLQNSPAMQVMRDFQNSPITQALQGIQNSPAMAAMRVLQDSPAMQAIRDFRNSKVMQSIQEFKNTPFKEVLSHQVFEKFLSNEYNVIPTEGGVEIVLDQEVESEILKEYKASKDFDLLSERTKHILLYVYHSYFLPVFLGCLSTIVMMNAENIQNRLQSVNSAKKVNSFARKAHGEIDKKLLKGYRIVVGKDLRLRTKPNMKSTILTMLPIGKLLTIISSSNRSWLHVLVEVDDDLMEGWVARQHTVFFK